MPSRARRLRRVRSAQSLKARGLLRVRQGLLRDGLHRDLAKFDVSTLVLHGEDDQIVPVRDSLMKSARLIKGAKDVYDPSAPHGITATHQGQVRRTLTYRGAGRGPAAVRQSYRRPHQIEHLPHVK